MKEKVETNVESITTVGKGKNYMAIKIETPEATKGGLVRDPEILAMKRIVGELDRLEAGTRERVLGWLMSRYFVRGNPIITTNGPGA